MTKKYYISILFLINVIYSCSNIKFKQYELANNENIPYNFKYNNKTKLLLGDDSTFYFQVGSDDYSMISYGDYKIEGNHIILHNRFKPDSISNIVYKIKREWEGVNIPKNCFFVEYTFAKKTSNSILPNFYAHEFDYQFYIKTKDTLYYMNRDRKRYKTRINYESSKEICSYLNGDTIEIIDSLLKKHTKFVYDTAYNVYSITPDIYNKMNSKNFLYRYFYFDNLIIEKDINNSILIKEIDGMDIHSSEYYNSYLNKFGLIVFANDIFNKEFVFTKKVKFKLDNE